MVNKFIICLPLRLLLCLEYNFVRLVIDKFVYVERLGTTVVWLRW